MSARVWFLTAVALLIMLVNTQRLPSQDDVADISSQDLRANKDESKRYFLVGPQKGIQAPKEGYGLLVVLPGGAGSADFHPFVKRIYKNALPDGYLVAQPVAVKWTEKQQIVWPTDKNRAEEMKFSTEDFVDAVIKDVTSWHKVNPERIFTLSWSSSGQAAYAVSLTSKKVTGSFIAMSVFKPELLPELKNAKGHGYFLYHSPDDRVCPFRMAEQAVKDLEESGATVKLATYEGARVARFRRGGGPGDPRLSPHGPGYPIRTVDPCRRGDGLCRASHFGPRHSGAHEPDHVLIVPGARRPGGGFILAPDSQGARPDSTPSPTSHC